MKKITAILLSTMIFAISVNAYAEIPDISNLSTDELLELKKRIGDLLLEQGAATELPFGEYIVGKDIAAGTYSITSHDSSGDNYGSNGWTVNIFNTSEDRANYEAAYAAADYDEEINIFDYAIFSQSPGNFDSINVTLEDGQLMVLERKFADACLLTIEQSKGLFIE